MQAHVSVKLACILDPESPTWLLLMSHGGPGLEVSTKQCLVLCLYVFCLFPKLTQWTENSSRKGWSTHQSYNLHSPPLKWICYKKKKSPPDNVFYLRGIFLYFCELNVWPDNCITMEVRLRSAGWQLYCRLCTQWTLNRMILDCSLFCNFYRHTANWALNCSPHWHSHICAFSCIIFYSCLVTRSCRSITKV